MLGLKNLFNKKEKIQNVDTFRKDYYEKNIIPEFNKYWNDEFVCEKLGLKSLAEGKVTVKNDLTVEDIKACDKRLGEILVRLHQAALFVFEPVSNYIKTNEEFKASFKNCKDTSKVKTFLFDGDKYVVDCLIKAYEHLDDKEVSRDGREVSIDCLIEYVDAIRTVLNTLPGYAYIAVEQELALLKAKELF